MFAFQAMSTNILVDTSDRRRGKLIMSDLWLRGDATGFMYLVSVQNSSLRQRMPLFCLGSATVSLTTYPRSLDLRQRCSRSTTSSTRSYYLHYSTTIVCPDMSVNCFRCLLDLVVSRIGAEQNVKSKTISKYLSSNIVFQKHTPAPGRGDCIQDQRPEIANQGEARCKSLLDNLRSSMSEEQLRGNDLARQKGSSA